MIKLSAFFQQMSKNCCTVAGATVCNSSCNSRVNQVITRLCVLTVALLHDIAFKTSVALLQVWRMLHLLQETLIVKQFVFSATHATMQQIRRKQHGHAGLSTVASTVALATVCNSSIKKEKSHE